MKQFAVLYFEETEELLQKVEYILISLESNYSIDEINELFRIVHSIKGSSQMMGYEQIGNLTHKIEDMLDSVRKQELEMNEEVLKLCFNGFDLVKDIFESLKQDEQITNPYILEETKKIENSINQVLIHNSKKETINTNRTPNKEGLMSTFVAVNSSGNKRYLITFTLSEGTQMSGVTLFMTLNNIKDIGTIIYTNVDEEHISGDANEASLPFYEILLSTDLEKSEIFPYLEITNVNKVSIIEAGLESHNSLSIPQKSTMPYFEAVFKIGLTIREVFFSQNPIIVNAKLNKKLKGQCELIEQMGSTFSYDATVQTINEEISIFIKKCYLLIHKKKSVSKDLQQVICSDFDRVFRLAFESIRGGFLIREFIVRNKLFLDELNKLVDIMDKSITKKILLNVTNIEVIEGTELSQLIQLASELEEKNISLSIIVSPLSKQMINIFEAIQSIKKFPVFYNEYDAVLGN